MPHSRRTILAATLGLAALATRSAAASPAIVTEGGGADAGEAFAARTLDGLTLSGRLYGDPAHPEILLIHGLGQSRLSWERQTGSALTQRFRVVTYDFRGHGDSDKPDDIAAYADGGRWADDVAAVIAASGLRRPVLVGWSLGGFAIGHYLARHGQAKIAGVNLVNAVTRLAPELLTATARDYAIRLASPDLGVRTQAIEGFLAVCFAKPPAPEAFRRMLVFNGMVPRAVQQGIVRMASEGLDQAFAATARLLVTYGAKDALTSRPMSQRVLALNAAARLSLYEDAGHTPFYEEPERFNAELAAFAAG
ncbi:alpha/beta fold hydrolase [Chelatococcus reniformis]|uniref:Alpha/beta hydrolase n=1 Tax=Chelatococcus reniformis TaxID=1494448 RepID=A0A916TX59_9HYPH|nr:alpha/beta hydrolase [Chelatococcus reniformis]GGC45202.1 alpha/beta hydrolase [Chelatococcus reniformis]